MDFRVPFLCSRARCLAPATDQRGNELAPRKSKRKPPVSGEWRHCELCLGALMICQGCNPLRRYCSNDCRQEARRRNHRSAVQRYSQSDKGRASQRIRQQRYRERLKTRAGVTDHNPAGLRHSRQNRPTLRAGINQRRVLESGQDCHFCGKGPVYVQSARWGGLPCFSPRPVPKHRSRNSTYARHETG
jgi:hypothetical protein